MVWSLFATEDNPSPGAVTREEQPAEEAFECDYERDCTPLYRALENAIEASEFEPICKFLDTGYWPGSFFADSIPPADQARTWVTRFDPIDNDKVRWSQLPLHLAIVCNAPPAIIGRLVRLYPQALRCTDDQHMLPLHLALRHNATDEVVAYLLIQFPDAVNAKGKNGRTSVDCALRAKDKLRGKILEIFIEKNKGKRSSAIMKEQKQLKADLQTKTEEVEQLRKSLDSMSSNFEEMKRVKNSVEKDLLVKIQELEHAKAELEVDSAEKIEKLQSEKLLESLELQQKLEAMEENNIKIDTAAKELRDEEEKLRAELDAIQERVAASKSPDDWVALKAEIQALHAYRLKHTRSQTQIKIASLRKELEVSMKEDKTKDIKSELHDIKQNVEKIQKDDVTSKNHKELNALRNEVDDLRRELKDRADASKARVELSNLKKAMEMELKHSEGKTKEELDALKKALDGTSINDLESKTNAELAVMKSELESLKKEMKNKELISKTKRDLDDIDQFISNELQSGDCKNKDEMLSIKKTSSKLRMDLESNDSHDALIAIKKEVEEIKDELKKKETTKKIINEAAALKIAVEHELQKSEGKTHQELLAMKKSIKSLNEKELASKDADELAFIKVELAEVKKGLKSLEYATQTQRELDELKKELTTEIKGTSNKTEEALKMMKAAVDAVNMEQKESKNLKKSLGEEIKLANKRTEKELIDMKKALDAIDVKKLESSNKDGWDEIRKEMETLKAELKAKQQDSIALEIKKLQQQVDNINLEKIKKENDTEFQSLRSEMEAMRNDMKQKDNKEAEMKQELEKIKKGVKKQKKGFKKFFSRRFTSNSPSSNTTESKTTTGGEESGSAATKDISSSADANHDINFKTIGPPSMPENGGTSTGTSGEDSSGDSSDGELMAKLSVSFADESVTDKPRIETVRSKDTIATGPLPSPVASHSKETTSVTSNNASPRPEGLPPMPPNMGMRKVVSMDPSLLGSHSANNSCCGSITPKKTPTSVEVPLGRVSSKASVSEDGHVEVEKVASGEAKSPVASSPIAA